MRCAVLRSKNMPIRSGGTSTAALERECKELRKERDDLRAENERLKRDMQRMRRGSPYTPQWEKAMKEEGLL